MSIKCPKCAYPNPDSLQACHKCQTPLPSVKQNVRQCVFLELPVLGKPVPVRWKGTANSPLVASVDESHEEAWFRITSETGEVYEGPVERLGALTHNNF